MTKKLKATLSMFLCAVMVLCSVAVGGMFANADTNTGKAIQLVKDGAAANISGGQASNIYFGTYKQSSDGNNGYNIDPIKWRVLENNASSKQLFLLSDQALDTLHYHTDYEAVTWATSTIRSWLNGTFYKSAFTGAEQEMIKSTNVTADANPNYNTDPGNDTTDNVFLLSINEVIKYFTSDEARKCVPTDYAIAQGAYTNDSYTVDGKATCWWWLRSPGHYGDYAASVDCDGGVRYYGDLVDLDYLCVRPALNLNLESVIFTSAAEGGKISSAEGGDAISKIADYSGNDWKVTLKDANRKFDITDKTAKSGKPGDTITLSYSGATIYNKDSTPNEYISVIITDSNGDAIYYGRITQPTSESGNVSITIPTDLDDGEYTLNVFSEQYNGGANDDTKLTDYASAFSVVDLTVEPYEISVNFDENSGDWTKGYTPPTSYMSNQTLTMPTKDNISRTGYTFDGWELLNTSSRTVKNYIAKWKINQYTLTFVLGNGEENKTITQDYNTNVTAPAPTRVGYTFEGWDKTVPSTMPAESVTYTAKWSTCSHAASTDKPTCEKSAVCSECSATLPATGHTYSEWKVTKSATFFKDGVETRTCINEGCTETETRVVLSKFSEFKSGLFGVDFLKAILTVFADLLTSVC
jgi:uncharacterized repeat protein (TIGR02543 family)